MIKSKLLVAIAAFSVFSANLFASLNVSSDRDRISIKDIDVIRELSKNENLLNELTEANSFLFAVESLDGIYSIEGYSDVYLYDLFCLKAESENIVSQEVLDTRATELGYETSGGVYSTIE